MGDKDSPLDGLFDGKVHSLTFYDVTDGKQIGNEIIADTLEVVSRGDLLDARDRLVCGTFSLDCKVEDDAALREFLYGGVDTDGEIKADIIVEGEPYINRPKNLKYPNKRRKMRIWKKWRKRFGVTPTQKAVIKNCTFKINNP